MGRVAEMVDPHCAHISKGGGHQAARTTSAESTRRHWHVRYQLSIRILDKIINNNLE